MSVAPAPAPVATRRRPITMVASLLAAALLLANAVVGFIAPDQVADHSAGAGQLSEALAGLSFIAGAIAILPLVPRSMLARIIWVLAVVSLVAFGLTMLSVVVTGVEPPAELVTVVTAAVGLTLIAIGIVGIMRGIWPWWVGVPVALLVPIMFFVPFNSVFMAVVWVLVAWRARAETPAAA
jgi:hypothetical protein